VEAPELAADPAYSDKQQASPARAKSDPEKIAAGWRERIQQAKAARRPFEKTWLSNLAFAAGQHWLVWDETGGGRLRHIQEVDPSQRGRTLYTADRINEFLQAQYGELNSDDDRPDILTEQDGQSAEDTAHELNLAVAHDWDHESRAADAIARARKYCLTMGHAALRRRFDASKGPVTDHQPVDQHGQPVNDPMALDMLEQHGVLPDGSLPRFQPVNEGRAVLEPYSPFQILTPPGVVHEDDFPWEVLVRPVLLEDVQEEYGAAADGLVEDTDIASAAGLSTGQNVTGQTATVGATGSSRLRGHVWLYTCFRRPCKNYPNGETCVLAGNSFTLLDHQPQLPYTDANGTPSAGIVYLHWWRLDDRFQSRSFIEPLKDPQRLINEQETMNAEIIARGLPKTFLKKGAIVGTPTGAPNEFVEMAPNADVPVFFPGTGPGDWMWRSLDHHADNLSHASTLSPLRLGENPSDVDTYSQLFLINENEGRKRDGIRTDHQRKFAKLVEFTVHDIRHWWPDAKMINVSGDKNEIRRQEFKKATVPDFFVVKVAEGAAAPRSAAAEVKKVDAIWAAAEQSGLAVQDPAAWTQWYADSLNAGEALDIPEVPKDSQQRFAEFENLLIEHGETPPVDDYDILPIHLPVHRELQDQARASGDMALYQRAKAHIDMHEQAALVNAAKVNALQPPPAPPAGPGAPAPAGGAGNPVFAAPDFRQLAAGN
jgi:hypothetical protein